MLHGPHPAAVVEVAGEGGEHIRCRLVRRHRVAQLARLVDHRRHVQHKEVMWHSIVSATKHGIFVNNVTCNQGFMQDKIIASHICFGGHMDVSC